MNKQEYNELNLIISYVALLVSNGDWEHTLQINNQLINHNIATILISIHYTNMSYYNCCGIRPKHSNISKGGGGITICVVLRSK